MERDEEGERAKSNWDGTRGKGYIERTKNREPRKFLVKLVEKLEPANAIELGIGAGNETRFLLEQGWKVLAIDINQESKNQVDNQLDENLQKNFLFKNQRFEELKLEKDSCDLLVAFDSLHFCNKKYFDEFFKNVLEAIKPKGYFVGNLLGINDSWRQTREDYMPFFTKEEIINLFSEFEIGENGIIESERDGKTAVEGHSKHWHSFFIKAKKK